VPYEHAAIGPQASSQRPTAPGYSFGSSSREAEARVFISKAHEQLKPSVHSPGPVYKLPSQLGVGKGFSFGSSKQRHQRRAPYPDSSIDLIEATVDSQTVKFDTPKGYLFGTESKGCMLNATILQTHPQVNYGLLSPGPVAYTPNEMCIARNPEQYSIASKHTGGELQAQTPANVGPGRYKHQAAIGTQISSVKKSLASWTMGKAKRFPESRTEPTAVEVPLNLPGVNAMGTQVKSRKATAAAFGFGTSTRDHKAKTFLVQTPLDKGPANFLPKPNLRHPKLPMEKELVKWTPRGCGNQGMN